MAYVLYALSSHGIRHIINCRKQAVDFLDMIWSDYRSASPVHVDATF